jgi:5-formyltetrahydrofolate cyclo-ligase
MTTVTSNDIQELKDLLSAMRQENRKQMIYLREETRKQIDTLKEDNRKQLETLREENNKQFINLHKEITEVKIITAKIEGIKKLETNSYCRYHCFYQCHNYLVYSRRKSPIQK